jgi:hypothetical protein
MEQTECSETLAYKIQTPGNYPEESTPRDLFVATWSNELHKGSFPARYFYMAYVLEYVEISFVFFNYFSKHFSKQKS